MKKHQGIAARRMSGALLGTLAAGVVFVAASAQANNADYCQQWVGAYSQCPAQGLHNVVTNEAMGQNRTCQRVEVVSTGQLLSRTCSNSGWAQSGNMGNVYRRNIAGNDHSSSQFVVGSYYH